MLLSNISVVFHLTSYIPFSNIPLRKRGVMETIDNVENLLQLGLKSRKMAILDGLCLPRIARFVISFVLAMPMNRFAPAPTSKTMCPCKELLGCCIFRSAAAYPDGRTTVTGRDRYKAQDSLPELASVQRRSDWRTRQIPRTAA